MSPDASPLPSGGRVTGPGNLADLDFSEVGDSTTPGERAFMPHEKPRTYRTPETVCAVGEMRAELGF